MDILYQIGVNLIPGISDINGKKLIAYCGGAEAVFKEKKSSLLKIPGFGEATINKIISQNVLIRAEKEIEFITQFGITPLYYLEPNYPERLKHCIDAPIMLYFRGNTDLNAPKILSIVGTRRASQYGKKLCHSIIKDLQDSNMLIVSGLAYGIDTQAHKSSLEYGIATIGVLAHGLDRIYPTVNKSLAEKMLNKGGLLTEFMSETNPDRVNFPKRNRIVAGLADAVLVIESALKGGALITADIANSYNRDVFAVPGRPSDSSAEGCNFLIKTNRASLVQNANDIKYFMGWEEAQKKVTRQRKIFVELSSEEEKLLKIVEENDRVAIDRICLLAQMPTSKVASTLLKLEFDGVVSCLPGKVFKIN